MGRNRWFNLALPSKKGKERGGGTVLYPKSSLTMPRRGKKRGEEEGKKRKVRS